MFVLLIALACGSAPAIAIPKSSVNCALPSYPDHGQFKVLGPDQSLLPGTIVGESTAITYYCDTNYDASVEEPSATCKGGKWNSPPPVCRKKCPMVRSLSVEFRCYKLGLKTDCTKFLPYGSVIKWTCKSGHHNPEEDFEELTCSQGGNWDNPIPDCKPDCGLEKNNDYSSPWHVGIFQRNEATNTHDQICGGSIIRYNLVISAANCFYDPIHQVRMDPKNFKVAAGKFSRSWDNNLVENTTHVQKSDVLAIYLPPTYYGEVQNNRFDLALLQLETPFRKTLSVRAVCYDIIDERFDIFHTEPENIGKVVGWGRTETGQPSDELKTLNLPVISYGECRTEFSKYKFSKYLTSDKLCAGFLNGSAMCRHDSGGGLVFPSSNRGGLTRWYLRGVVSSGPLNDAKTTCRANAYSIFTSIFKMKDWLKKTIREVTRPVTTDE